MKKITQVFKLTSFGFVALNFWNCNSGGPTAPMDTTPPVVTIKAPIDGFITNSGSVSIVCNVDGIDQASQIKILNEGANLISCSAKDSAGNLGKTAEINIYQKSHVLFVKKGVIGGDGSSWQKAYGDLAPALANPKTDTAGTQVWISDGEYSPDENGYKVQDGISLFGGFPNVGQFFDLSQRDSISSKTILKAVDIINNIMDISDAFGSKSLQNVQLNSLQFEGTSQNGLAITGVEAIKILNCGFSGMEGFKAVFFTDGDGIFKNCKFHDNIIGNNIVEAWGITAKGLLFENCVFEKNKVVLADINASGEMGNLSLLNNQILDPAISDEDKKLIFDLPLVTFRGCKIVRGILTIDNTRSGSKIDYDTSNSTAP